MNQLLLVLMEKYPDNPFVKLAKSYSDEGYISGVNEDFVKWVEYTEEMVFDSNELKEDK